MSHVKGWRAICDRCGFEFYSFELKKEWNGLMTCNACWEPRHPQDFVRAVRDEQTVPWTRPEPEDEFVPVCYLEGLSGYAGLGVAGCMIAGNNQFTPEFLLGLNDGYV
jgi:hypothetical protein